MNRDNWKEIPVAEWKRWLNQVREVALQRLAAHGLGDDDRNEDIGGMIGLRRRRGRLAPQSGPRG